jgi:hypothetical protein
MTKMIYNTAAKIKFSMTLECLKATLLQNTDGSISTWSINPLNLLQKEMFPSLSLEYKMPYL